ncbi:unnamed protein product, partial [Polarella glacialis]
YRRVFQEAWLKLLGLRVPLTHCSPLLQLLPTRVMPHLSRPLMLSDFYLRAFHAGAVIRAIVGTDAPGKGKGKDENDNFSKGKGKHGKLPPRGVYKQLNLLPNARLV